MMVDVITHEAVRRIALGFPNAEQRASYGGRPSWRTPKQMFASIREHPEALVVWVESEEDKLAMIGSEPDKFFTTDHYDGHPIVLVDLDGVDIDEATELITESWRLRAPKRAVAAWDETHT
jgi:hypothetical protein